LKYEYFLFDGINQCIRVAEIPNFSDLSFGYEFKLVKGPDFVVETMVNAGKMVFYVSIYLR
jgi:hypothetical protein